MARAPAPTTGQRLCAMADQLYALGDAYDATERDSDARRRANDLLEELAGEVRSVPRGRGFR